VRRTEGFGFAIINSRTGQFTAGPTDVVAPDGQGDSLPGTFYFGSPVVSGNNVTLFWGSVCPGGVASHANNCPAGLQEVTMPATVDALSSQASYSVTMASASSYAWQDGAILVNHDPWRGYVAVNHILATGLRHHPHVRPTKRTLPRPDHDQGTVRHVDLQQLSSHHLPTGPVVGVDVVLSYYDPRPFRRTDTRC
jgi:hypothetical protein